MIARLGALVIAQQEGYTECFPWDWVIVVGLASLIISESALTESDLGGSVTITIVVGTIAHISS